MNLLAIDYGTKTIGLAYSVNDIIFTLKPVKNDSSLISNLQKILKDYHIDKIYIGLSEGEFADQTRVFTNKLSTVLKLPIETVEEAVSTIEADVIFKKNKKNIKNYKKQIDSVAAAVILNRVLI